MKKAVSLVLALGLTLSIMTGCASSAPDSKQNDVGSTAEAAETEEIETEEIDDAEIWGTEAAAEEEPEVVLDGVKTIGDLLEMDGVEEAGTCCYDEKYVYWFEANGTDYRAIADITLEQSEEINEIYQETDDFEEKLREAIAPLEISRIDNLSEMIPADEEMQAFVGKTGQDLLDNGWTTGGYNLDGMEFYMNYKEYGYTVVFNGELEMEKVDEIGEEEAIKDLTIQSITYSGIFDGTYLEDEE